MRGLLAKIYQAFKPRKLLPYLVLIILIALSLLIWRFYLNHNRQSKELLYNDMVENVIDEITDRLHRYEMILKSGASIFIASEEVTRDEWHIFYEYQQVGLLYPGMRGVLFSELIEHPELENHLERLRAEGYPDYIIWPEGIRDIYAPVVFKEPIDACKLYVLGYDMLADPMRKAALEQARESGEAVLSGLLPHISESNQSQTQSPELLMTMAVFDQLSSAFTTEERHASTIGYVTAVFRVADLLQDIQPAEEHIIEFKLYDGNTLNPETLLYNSTISQDSDSSSRQQPLFTSRHALDRYGRNWTLVFETTPAFETAAERYTAAYVLLTGLATSFLVFLYLQILQTTGERARNLAGNMTVALRESEEQLKKITDNVTDAVVICDLEGIMHYASPQSAVTLRREPEELVGKSVFEIAYEEDLPAVIDAFRYSIENAAPNLMSCRVEGKDGTLVWIETRGDFLYENGKMSSIVLVARDITERREAEDKLKQEHQEKELILNNLSEKVSYLDREMNIVWTNDLVNQSSDIRVEDYRGRKCYNFFLQRSEPCPDCPIMDAFKTGKPCGGLHREPGDRYWQMHGVPIHNDEGRLIGVLDTALEVTELMRADKALRKSLAELETLNKVSVALRTAETVDEMLNQLIDETLQVFNTDAAAICFYHPRDETLRFRVTRGWFNRLSEVQLQIGESIAGKVFRSKEIHLSKDFSSDPLFKCASEAPTGWGGACLPLRVASEIVGVLFISVPEGRTVSSEDVKLLQSLVEMAGTAIHRISLHTETVQLLEQLKQSNIELTLSYEATIEGWSRALDLRDHETEGHSRRVAEMAVTLAAAMAFDGDELLAVRRGALLHDIGKVAISDTILLKPEPLNEDEWRLMRKHPQFAFDLLYPIEYLRPALDIPYCHHEKYDGSGYPQGLKAEEIPLAARIFAVVDVYDALTSDRPYRKAWSKEAALKLISEESGKHFDPEVVKIFLHKVV